ncbi:hypothetical protein SLS62_002736 [Diatrype stigma]|uniref:alpha-1,2-Mannosidase n=1 Tax=Diatrype stigma TaxID=117547 RepID=A0AAN9UWM1_9PEZI
MLTGRRRYLLPLGLATFFLVFYSYWTYTYRGGQGRWAAASPGGFLSSSQGHHSPPPPHEGFFGAGPGPFFVDDDPDYFWRRLPVHYPVQSPRPLPLPQKQKQGAPLPRIQIQTAAFGAETARDRETRLARRAAVRATFERCWASYKRLASPADELTPLSGGARDTFGGWGATLVDSLDTLWIMGLTEEFEEAVAIAARIDFTPSSSSSSSSSNNGGRGNLPREINVFETTIRYLGGFLSAYDLSGDRRLLRKAREAGDMLLAAFDTPNRMPVTRWDAAAAAAGEPQAAPGWALVAEVGSLCMEFTRLSLVTGDPRFFDATERIREVLEEQQGSTKLPGMWPISVNPRDEKFDTDNTFGLGAMADSVFEYLPKMAALLGGLDPSPSYEAMYTRAMDAAIKNCLFRPMTPDNADILVSGTVKVSEATDGDGTRRPVPALEHRGQHLVCFAGGMFAVGGRLTRNAEHLEVARQLTDGCIWAYRNMPLGIMPETFGMVPCDPSSQGRAGKGCAWDEMAWKRGVLEQAGDGEDESATDAAKAAAADRLIVARRLPPGFASIPDGRYLLRPEAIESVFVLWRATGRRDLPEAAWAMFAAVENSTRTALASAALDDVTDAAAGGRQSDSMESFWLGETLKYFYLVFSEPDLISLDEWVFNTEAHPFRRLVP